MSSGQLKRHDSFNSTVIKNGMIVRLRKDGRVKAILDEYKPKHKNVSGKQ
jgi:hypothetical protein